MNPFSLLRILLLGLLCSAGGQTPALSQQPKLVPFNLGLVQTIQSSVLAETRTLNIYLPDGYSADSATTYPVVYLLDGSANEDFIHIAGIVQFLTMIEAIPKSILVGIANVDRRRDFTFPTRIAQDKKDFPTTGSSAKFMDFLETELQPFIQRTYRTNGIRTLIGQSLGGLLAVEVLLKKPTLFDNYMIVSPSLWWDNESLLTTAHELLARQGDWKTSVYVCVGAEGKQMEADANRLLSLLQATSKKGLSARLLILPNENHLTILHNAVYQSFGVLYPQK